MKTKTTIAVFGLLAAMSFGASAAQLVNEQPDNMTPVGTVTLSGVGDSSLNVRQQLSQKADEQGATAYRIVEAKTGDAPHFTAELYK